MANKLEEIFYFSTNGDVYDKNYRKELVNEYGYLLAIDVPKGTYVYAYNPDWKQYWYYSDGEKWIINKNPPEELIAKLLLIKG